MVAKHFFSFGCVYMFLKCYQKPIVFGPRFENKYWNTVIVEGPSAELRAGSFIWDRRRLNFDRDLKKTLQNERAERSTGYQQIPANRGKTGHRVQLATPVTRAWSWDDSSSTNSFKCWYYVIWYDTLWCALVWYNMKVHSISHMKGSSMVC